MSCRYVLVYLREDRCERRREGGKEMRRDRPSYNNPKNQPTVYPDNLQNVLNISQKFLKSQSFNEKYQNFFNKSHQCKGIKEW